MSWYSFRRTDGSEFDYDLGTDESVVGVMRRYDADLAWPVGMPRHYLNDVDPRQMPLFQLPDGWRVYTGGRHGNLAGGGAGQGLT